MKAFVKKFYDKQGMYKKADAVKDIPVLKPKQGIKYLFTA